MRSESISMATSGLCIGSISSEIVVHWADRGAVICVGFQNIVVVDMCMV